MSIGIHVGRVIYPEIDKNILWAVQTFPKLECVQIFTNNPKTGQLLDMDTKAVQATGIRIYIHSSYVCTLLNKMPVWQLSVADKLGAAGVVFHLPAESADVIAMRVDLLHAKTKILLEMRAMRPGPYSFETPDKIIGLATALAQRSIKPERCGIVIDTAHIFAGGTPIRTASEASAFLAALDPIKDYIALLHLNGNQETGFRDRHCAPLDVVDKIWGGIEWQESGCRVFCEYFLSHKKDIIMEQAMQDKQTFKIIQLA